MSPINDTVEVVGQWLRANGVPEIGTVSIRPLVAAGNWLPQPHMVTLSAIVLTLDDKGSISTMLYASDSPGWNVDAQVPYKFQLDLQGYKQSYYAYIVGPGKVNVNMIDHYSRSEVVTPKPVSSVQMRSRSAL